MKIKLITLLGENPNCQPEEIIIYSSSKKKKKRKSQRITSCSPETENEWELEKRKQAEKEYI